MIVEHRAALAALIGELPFPVHRTVPGDVAEVPCLVLGAPSVGQDSRPGILSLTSNIYVIGRRVDVAERDDELEEMCDMLLIQLGGSHGVMHDNLGFSFETATAQTLSIAGVDFPTYVVTVESSAVTC